MNYVIIDDSPYWAEAVRLALTRPAIAQKGDSIVIATGVNSVVQGERILSNCPDDAIVFIDVIFPDNPGACQLLCRKTKWHHRYNMPVVMTVAPKSNDFIQAINNFGAVGYISKTYDVADFETQVWSTAEQAKTLQQQLKSHEEAVRQVCSHTSQNIYAPIKHAFEQLLCHQKYYDPGEHIPW